MSKLKEGIDQGLNPILVNKGSESSINLKILKCSCNSTWCPHCFKRRTLPRVIERLKFMDWHRVRFVTLTLSPETMSKYIDIDEIEDKYKGQYVHEFINEKKTVASMIRNFERVSKILIHDWVWFLEWHENGFPHWHLFIEVDQVGKEGMIGQETIHRYWKYGAIREEPIRNERHWNKLLGYAEKNGYFEKKKQSILPEWGLEYKKNIRRIGGKKNSKYNLLNRKKGNEKQQDKKQSILKEMKKLGDREMKKERKKYSVILSGCGMMSRLEIFVDSFYSGMIDCDIPYRELIRKLPKDGTYIEGVGFVVELTETELAYVAEEVEEIYTLQDRFENYLLEVDGRYDFAGIYKRDMSEYIHVNQSTREMLKVKYGLN